MQTLVGIDAVWFLHQQYVEAKEEKGGRGREMVKKGKGEGKGKEENWYPHFLDESYSPALVFDYIGLALDNWQRYTGFDAGPFDLLSKLNMFNFLRRV